MECINCKKKFKPKASQRFCSIFCRIKFNSYEDENGCWVSTLKSSDKRGYTRICLKNHKHVPSHRKMYEEYYDTTLIRKIYICHSCDNPKCVNPKHLFAGTHQDNMDDCKRKGRWVKKTGSLNGSNKLDEQKVYEIKNLIKSGMKIYEISRKFEVHIHTIYLIKQGKTWKHVSI